MAAQARPAAARREALAILALLACFGLAWIVAGSNGRTEPDETFFAQVTSRVVTGEALYRDVAYIPTPFAVYAAAPVIALFGPELVVVRGLYFLVFAATCPLAVHITRARSRSRSRTRRPTSSEA